MTKPNRRGRGEGAIYQRRDGHWVASLDLGWRDGRRVRKVRYAKTRAGAVKKLGEMQREHAASALVASSPTVEAWLRYWRDEIATKPPKPIRPSTLKGYNTYIEQHIIPRIGRHRLDRLEPSHVRRMYADMREHPLAESSVRQAHAILSRALKVAVREGKASRNVCELVDPPGTGKNPRTPLTVDQARTVLAYADDHDDVLVSRWYAALWLGLRQGEALGLRWTHVNLDEGWLFVEVAVQRVKGKGLVVVSPKSATSIRYVPVPPMVAARLRIHWARHVAAGGGVDGYVWGNGNGGPTDPAKDYKAWGRLLDDAKVPHVALHAARNTSGSLLMASGVPDKVAAEILGHSTIQVTQEHYQRGDVEQRAKAMLALEAYASDTKDDETMP